MRPGSAAAPLAVRQAVAAVVDRSKVASQVHKGTVTPLYSLVPAGITTHGTPFFETYPRPTGPPPGSSPRTPGSPPPCR